MKMESTKKVDELSVLPDPTRATEVRKRLIADGYRPDDVYILDSRKAAMTKLLAGPSIPEAIAGFVGGALLGLWLALVPPLTPIFDSRGLPGMLVVGICGLAGAILSYLVAGANQPPVIDREIRDGEYVVVARREQSQRRAA